MAVPQDLPTGFTHGSSNQVGPFFVNGAVYFITVHATNLEPAVFKADDPDTASFTEQDSANRPTAVSYRSVAAWVEGTDLLIIHDEANSNGALRYSVFHCATDLWSVSGDGDYDQQIATKASLGQSQPNIVVRGAGDPVVAGNYNAVKFMGTDHWQIFIHRRSATIGSGSWTAEIQVSTDSDSDHWGPTLVHGGGNRVHVFYVQDENDANTTFHLMQRTFTSSNTFGTEQIVGNDVFSSGSQAADQIGHPARYDVGGTIHVRVPNLGLPTGSSASVCSGDSTGDTPTWSTENAGDDNAYKLGGVGGLVNDPTTDSTIHLIYGSLADGDVNRDEQTDGGSWGTDVGEIAAAMGTGHKCRVAEAYDHGTGNVIGVPFNDNGTWKYEEISLGGALAISLPHIASTVTLSAPALALNITLPHIASGVALFAPSLAHQVDLPAIGSTAALFAPSVAPGPVTITLPLIAATTNVFPPLVSYLVQMPAIAAGTGLSPPSIAYQVDLPEITSTTSLFAMIVAPGAVGITLPAIGSSATLFAPTLANQVDLPTIAATIASSSTTFAPVLSYRLELPAIGSSAALFVPSLVHSANLPFPVGELGGVSAGG